jgi:two-component system, cell cycle response regulator
MAWRSAHTRVVRSAPEEVDGDAHEVLVTICGASLGSKTELDPSRAYVLGRDIAADMVLDDDSVSRTHCRLLRDGGAWCVEDLGSTNGTYVDDVAVEGGQALRDGAFIKVGSTIFKFLSANNVEAAYHEEIYRMAIFDGLTQIHNRRYFEEFAERELARCRRHHRPLALLLFDVDHFKQINDNFGHLSGDHVLHTMSNVVRARIRREELFARYAGDEFVIVLPESEGPDSVKFGQMLVELVHSTEYVFDGQQLPVSISLGAAGLTDEMRSPSELLAAADAALYRAKQKGRNCVAL